MGHDKKDFLDFLKENDVEINVEDESVAPSDDDSKQVKAQKLHF
jgi:hypothetical protein